MQTLLKLRERRALEVGLGVAKNWRCLIDIFDFIRSQTVRAPLALCFEISQHVHSKIGGNPLRRLCGQEQRRTSHKANGFPSTISPAPQASAIDGGRSEIMRHVSSGSFRNLGRMHIPESQMRRSRSTSKAGALTLQCRYPFCVLCR